MTDANNKDADQPAHPCRLIIVFIIRSIYSTFPIHVDSIPKFSRLYLASVAEQAGLSLTWSQTSEDRFSPDVAHIYND